MRALFLLLLLAACAALPGPVAQLDRMTKAQAEGRDAANADETPDASCTAAGASDPACARIQAIRGRACLSLARAQAAAGAACPPPGAKRFLDCAVESYAHAGGASTAGSADALAQTENTVRAQYCAAGFRAPAEGLGLLRQARAGVAGLAPGGQADLLAASVALSIAQKPAAPNDERCSAARDAARLSARGLGAASTDSVTSALRATGNAARQEAAGITGCTGL